MVNSFLLANKMFFASLQARYHGEVTFSHSEMVFDSKVEPDAAPTDSDRLRTIGLR